MTWVTLPLYLLLLSTTADGARDCALLIMADGDRQIESSDLCTTELVTAECLPFVQSNNLSDLPEVFKGDLVSLGKPSNLNIVGLANDYEDPNSNISYKVPGLQIKWESPASETIRRNVKGYRIAWETENKTACRLFHLNSSSPYLLKKISFKYNIQSLYSGGAYYTVKVNSILEQYAGGNEDEGQLDTILLSSFGMYKYATDPALWSPSVSTKTWTNGSIEVRFTLSPPEFNITQFDILLLKETFSTSDYYKLKTYKGIVFSSDEPEGIVQFDRLTSDRYYIIVRPIDTFRLDEKNCLCWKKTQHSLCPEDQCCEASCYSMRTQWFQLDVSGPLTTSSPVTAHIPVTTVHKPATTVATMGVTHDSTYGLLTTAHPSGLTNKNTSQIQYSDTNPVTTVSWFSTVNINDFTPDVNTWMPKNTTRSNIITGSRWPTYNKVFIVASVAVSLLLVVIVAIIIYCRRSTKSSVQLAQGSLGGNYKVYPPVKIRKTSSDDSV